MASAAFTVQDGSATAATGTGTVSVTAGNTITVALSSTAGAANTRVKLRSDIAASSVNQTIYGTATSVTFTAPLVPTDIAVEVTVETGNGTGIVSASYCTIRVREAATQQVVCMHQAVSAGAITETTLCRLQGTGSVVGVYYLPDGVSTPSSGSNSQALAISIRDGAGGAAAGVAAASIANATPTAAFVPFSLGTITNGAYTDGMVLTVKSTLTGTASVPVGVWMVVLAPTTTY